MLQVKLQGPSTCLSILGIELDSTTLQAQLSPKKRQRITAFLGRWADKRFCRRLELKGLKIGTTYNNDKSAKMFTQAIADTERAMVKTEIEESKFSSLLSDGATDLSVTENEIVYVRVCKQGTISVIIYKVHRLYVNRKWPMLKEF